MQCQIITALIAVTPTLSEDLDGPVTLRELSVLEDGHDPSPGSHQLSVALYGVKPKEIFPNAGSGSPNSVLN